ncbi:MAG: response regulator/pilus assembly protein [candidate division Zixibacteria bacterium]|nr:response regulator/pilus assembly protein [candidate division Zixibacteria bacterium]NIR64088.1 response regulator/pilus assembly protein [candidate division Zixibacteria bacterium]NIS15417.1 response regulator/pilus assembly protein [candidate division Zixibacteria bacterium]NIS45986.1 response regulator/pilus assembly protein [candidate division Zixibacteria bacterium]NIT51945.1 response regulator/pilus assembly protein [candidate division Zixibacteria bacterium]
MNDQLTIIMVQADDSLHKVIKDHIDEIEEIRLISEVGDIGTCYENMESLNPDIVLIDLHKSSDVENIFAVSSKMSIDYPDTAIFVSSEMQEPQLILRALRSGAQEFFSKPLKIDEFKDAVERIVLKKQRLAQVAPPKSRVISVFSKKGGLGVTTLAVNIAGALAKISKQKAAIFDLDLQLGDVTSFLDLTPQYNIFDACDDMGQVDGTKLQSCMTHHKLGISILAEPTNPADSNGISAAHIGQILDHLKSMYPYVLIDTSHTFDSKNLEVFAQSDYIFLVSVSSIPAIRATRKTLDYLRNLGYDENKIKIVINRFNKRDKIKVEEIEKILDFPVFWSIPNNYRASIDAIDAGLPLVGEKRLTNVGKSIFKLAKVMTNGDFSNKTRRSS